MAAPALKDIPEGNPPAIVEENPPASANESETLFDIGVDKAEMGSPGSVRHTILACVLEERYDKAIEALKDILDKPSEYPNFKFKVSRYINHGVDLIYAIKAKRSFPGISSLTRAKQQELREKFKEHYRELQYVLKVVEKIQVDLRVQDVRSTIYVVRALWYAGLAIFILGFWLDIVQGLGKTTVFVIDDFFGRFANWLAGLLGF